MISSFFFVSQSAASPANFFALPFTRRMWSPSLLENKSVALVSYRISCSVFFCFLALGEIFWTMGCYLKEKLHPARPPYPVSLIYKMAGLCFFAFAVSYYSIKQESSTEMVSNESYFFARFWTILQCVGLLGVLYLGKKGFQTLVRHLETSLNLKIRDKINLRMYLISQNGDGHE